MADPPHIGAEIANADSPQRLRMYGGPWVAVVPVAVLIGVFVWLSVAERASDSTFWVGGWAAIVVGLLLVRTKREYADSIVRGLSDRVGMVIVAAFIFAGIFGQLMEAGGLVDGLLWLGLVTGIQGAPLTVLIFLLACLFAVGTGTSLGTAVSLTPVLYPAGVMLGGDPIMAAMAIFAGAAFGDNIAPISDSTICSAYTQEASMGDVVRSRLPLALSAAGVSIVVFLVLGGGGKVAGADRLAADASPVGLVMFIPFVIVLASALLHRHIIESLTWGSLSAIVIGILSGQFGPQDIFSIPAEKEGSTGLVQDAIEGVTGVIVLVFFVLAIGRFLADAGVMTRVLAFLERHAARGVRSAEIVIVLTSLVVTIPLSANAAAILLIGPTLAKPLGGRFNLAPARKANLMDCAACTIFFMLPWHNAVIAWYGATVNAAKGYGLPEPTFTWAFANPYAWALLAVILVSAITGWNRKYATSSP